MDVWAVCTKKVVIAFPDQIVANAIEIMSVNHIRRLPILEHRHLVGMITTADLVRVFAEKSALDGLAERLDDIMSTNTVTVDPYAELSDTARLMLDHDIGSMPVVIRGTEEMVGIITERDLLNTMVMIPEACKEAGLLRDFELPSLPTCQPTTPIKEALRQLGNWGSFQRQTLCISFRTRFPISEREQILSAWVWMPSPRDQCSLFHTILRYLRPFS
jgi:CBS domain-containing protein